jgi:hypothetical protein
MPVLPPGSVVTVTNGVLTSNFIAKEVNYSPVSEYFQRAEFTQKRIKEVLEENGAAPVFISTYGGTPFQISSVCGSGTTPRVLTPDDSRIDDIYKKWSIKRFNLTIDISANTDMENMYEMARQHRILLDRFDYHQTVAANGNVSIAYLEDVLQPETFSYLTATSTALSGPALTSAYSSSSVLITNFSISVEREIPSPASLYKAGTLTLETRILQSARATS